MILKCILDRRYHTVYVVKMSHRRGLW